MSARPAAARASVRPSIEQLIGDAIAALPVPDTRPDFVSAEARSIVVDLAPVLEEARPPPRWPPSEHDATWYGGRPRDERLHVFTRLLAWHFERLTGQSARRTYEPDFEFGSDFTGFLAAVLEAFGARDGLSYPRTGSARRAVGVEPTRRAGNTASYLVRVFTSERKQFETLLSDRAYLASMIKKYARRPSAAEEWESLLARLNQQLLNLELVGWKSAEPAPSVPALLHQGTKCRTCGDRIPHGRRLDAVFCSRKCQLRARRRRRE